MDKILCFVGPLYEDLELWYPMIRLREAGYQVDIAGAKKEEYKGKNGIPCTPDTTFKEAQEQSYDGLIIPGGYAPDKMRMEKEALELVRAFKKAGKPIGIICHAGWMGASAGIVKGVTMTSVANIKDDLVNAGANWVDKEAVTDQGIISARTPADLPAYMKAYLTAMEQTAKSE